MNNDIENFHLPRWNELPNIDLYIDQLVSLLEHYLSGYIQNDNDKNGKLITKAMINNYVNMMFYSPLLIRNITNSICLHYLLYLF